MQTELYLENLKNFECNSFRFIWYTIKKDDSMTR